MKNTYGLEKKTFELGIMQGSKSKAFSVAKKLLDLGCSIEEVSNITDLSYLEIKRFFDF